MISTLLSEKRHRFPMTLRPDPALAWEVRDEELARLFGYPDAFAGRRLEGEVREGARRARAWYADEAAPFVFASLHEFESVELDSVEIRGHRLSGLALASSLREADAHAVVLLALTAGAEVDREVRRLWRSERPDAAFFLDRMAAAVAEALPAWTTHRLAEMAEPHGVRLLRPMSPGNSEWALRDQRELWDLLTEEPGFPEGLRLGAEGMLQPIHSMLSLVGLTSSSAADPGAEEMSCRRCRLASCSFRRRPQPERSASDARREEGTSVA